MKNSKIIILILLLLSQSYGFMGFGSSDNIDIVKNTKFSMNKNITFEEALNRNKTYTDITWENKEAKNGQKFVMVKCKANKKVAQSLGIASGNMYFIFFFTVNNNNVELFETGGMANGRYTLSGNKSYPQFLELNLKEVYKK